MVSQPHHLSKRTSCDRCRSQKLKCTRDTKDSEAVEQCTRCIRAKVDCVFGRRTQAKRYRVKSQPGDAENDQLCASLDGVPRQFEESNKMSPPNMLINPVCWSQPWGQDDTVAATRKSQHVLDGLVPGVGNGAATSAQNYPFAGGLQEPELRRPPSLCNSSGSSNDATPISASPTFLTSRIDFSSPLDFSSFPPQNEVSELSMISYETQDLLNTINNSQWLGSNDINNLNHYPIGQLVNVAQRFASVLVKVSQSSSSQMHGDGNTLGLGVLNAFFHKSSDDYSGTTTPQRYSDTTDAPTSLLTLSCYLSMRKLFFFVLNQLEKHVYSTPDQRIMSTPYRDLQLGQLPSTNDTYGRIYIAVQMILDVFQSVEDLLRLSDSRIDLSMRRDSLDSTQDGFMSVIHTEIPSAGQAEANGFSATDSTPSFQCIFDSQTRARVDSLKAMLRERMN